MPQFPHPSICTSTHLIYVVVHRPACTFKSLPLKSLKQRWRDNFIKTDSDSCSLCSWESVAHEWAGTDLDKHYLASWQESCSYFPLLGSPCRPPNCFSCKPIRGSVFGQIHSISFVSEVRSAPPVIWAQHRQSTVTWLSCILPAEKALQL